jgi:hypothetical protein
MKQLDLFPETLSPQHKDRCMRRKALNNQLRDWLISEALRKQTQLEKSLCKS